MKFLSLIFSLIFTFNVFAIQFFSDTPGRTVVGTATNGVTQYNAGVGQVAIGAFNYTRSNNQSYATFREFNLKTTGKPVVIMFSGHSTGYISNGGSGNYCKFKIGTATVFREFFTGQSISAPSELNSFLVLPAGNHHIEFQVATSAATGTCDNGGVITFLAFEIY